MIKIITDTTAGLPPGIARKFNIPVIPQIVTFGEESFKEGIDLDNKGFMQRLMASKDLPKTAAPPPALFTEYFLKWAAEKHTILCIHPSCEVSGTVRSAQVAAQDFPGADIRVIDTRLIASPLATLVELAARWAEAGIDADTIVNRLSEMSPRCKIYFMVETLEYLARGGRIGGAAALLGSMLQVKPILTLENGRIEQYERERTHQRAVKRLKELVINQIPKDKPAYLSVMHAGVPDRADKIVKDLSEVLKLKDIPILDVPPAIVTHGGPGILAVAFFI